MVLLSINKRSLPYATHNKQLDVSLGIEKIGTSSHEEIIFITKNIQSKIEWVEAIEKALMSHSSPPQIDSAKSIPSSDDHAELKAKELKAVLCLLKVVDRDHLLMFQILALLPLQGDQNRIFHPTLEKGTFRYIHLCLVAHQKRHFSNYLAMSDL